MSAEGWYAVIFLLVIGFLIGYHIGNYKGKNNTNKKILRMLEEDHKAWLTKNTQK